MDTQTLIRRRVATYFVSGDNNCAMTMLRVLAEIFDVPLAPSVVDAAQCMPGAGGVGGLCGLVSGVLMFIGVWAGHHGLHRRAVRSVSEGISEGVRQRFGSLHCDDLRNDCGALAVRVLDFAVLYLEPRFAALLAGPTSVLEG